MSSQTEVMQAMLLRHGQRFSGSNPQDEAGAWVDQGFSADGAEAWCEIGVWDAATAAVLRDAGLSPRQAKAAAESLTEGLDDPADVYTDGDPIYALCNGDVLPRVIIEAAK